MTGGSTTPRSSPEAPAGGPASAAPSVGEVSHLMRESLADEMARELREQMALLAQGVEQLQPTLQASPWSAHAAQARVQSLQRQLAEHLNQLAELPASWQASPEQACYRHALRDFQGRLLGCEAWLQGEAAPASEPVNGLLDSAWRALGEGMLLLDLHSPWPPTPSGPQRPWWRRWLRW